MPWTDEQALLLREFGVSWVPRVRAVPAPSVPSARAAQAQPAAVEAPSIAAPAAAPRVAPTVAGSPVSAGSHSQPATTGAPDHGGHPRPLPAAAQPAADVPPAPTVAVAGLDWDELARAVDACRACGLGHSRTHAVFGVGSRSARWLIVGEAPGEQEDLRGEPFVGAAGRLLDSMLSALGLARSAERTGSDATDGPVPPAGGEVYIANTLKCRPPGNRNPQPDELSCCEPFLVRQIELLQPRIIVAMGRFAVQSLLRSPDPIGRLRGRVHRYRGLPLVVTYHPAYLLRNPVDKARAWEDLCLAAATLEAAA